MPTSNIFVKSALAQTPEPSQPSPLPTTTKTNPLVQSSGQIWIFACLALVLLIIGLAVYGKLELNKMEKKLRIEQYKAKDLKKKLKLAISTIRKMETNPDLVDSREFNLDYLRMRMEDKDFHFTIVNQVKIQVKQLITIALRPTQATKSAVGIASVSGRQVDEIFDVTYETERQGKPIKRVLFRIEVKLMKLPTQATSMTINQIIDCIEKYLSSDDDKWQPTIQGHIVTIDWDQKAKPTPLLVLQQSNENVNVTFRTKRGNVS
ncbi:MAG: hypothetical protein F6K47_19390 [Symploca sp. SIO2E6]|nr:hypothetical protein [Symploca sp. SIO2E6]